VTTVGLLGIGQMGAAIARRLAENGVETVTAAAGRSAQTVARIAETGVRDLGDAASVVRSADIVLSVMGSASAPAAAGDVARAVARTGARPAFAECNLISPAQMTAICAELNALGVDVIDVGIVGDPPTAERSPTFYASGPRLEPLQFLSDCRLDVRPVGDQVGAASALKLCTAAVWQGALAMVTDVLAAAAYYGCATELIHDLDEHQAELFGWYTAAVGAAPPRAARWQADMEVIASALATAGSSPSYYQGAQRLYRELAQQPDPGRDRNHILAALAAARTRNQTVPTDGGIADAQR
jgi:3-hydroxyisobutyrate dehydrogenase-like beta-hydroxyacid dehydrogenase